MRGFKYFLYNKIKKNIKLAYPRIYVLRVYPDPAKLHK